MGIVEARKTVLELIDRLRIMFADKSERYGDSWYDKDPDFRVISLFCEKNAKYNRMRKLIWEDRCKDKVLTAETLIDDALFGILSAASLIELMTTEERKQLETKLNS